MNAPRMDAPQFWQTGKTSRKLIFSESCQATSNAGE
jgi:hypothetical protein